MLFQILASMYRLAPTTFDSGMMLTPIKTQVAKIGLVSMSKTENKAISKNGFTGALQMMG